MPQFVNGSMRRYPTGYEITRGDIDEVDRLIEINLAADQLFAGTGLVENVDLTSHIPAEVFAQGLRDRDVFMARDIESGEAVGFTLTSERGGTLYLDQISVVPDHGQKGLGRALMARIETDAKDRNLRTVTLSTFREVQWNGPFYRSLGYREIKPARITDWMKELESLQAQTLDVSKRCFMTKRVRWL